MSATSAFVDRTETGEYDYSVYHTQTEIENWSIRMSELHDHILGFRIEQVIIFDKSQQILFIFSTVMTCQRI